MIKRMITAAVLALFQSTAFAQIYKCQNNGEMTFQSDPCPITKRSKPQKDTFGFDGWEFGTSIPAMKLKARERNIGISPGYMVSYMKGFNKKLIDSNPKALTYKYRAKVMGKDSTVSLLFTKTTKELYQTKAVFNVMQSSHEERKYFYESLFSLLSKKYGKPIKMSKDDVTRNQWNPISKIVAETLLGKQLVWGNGTDNIVTLSYRKDFQRMNAYELSYRYSPLVLQNSKEITYELRMRTNEAVLVDESKL